MRHSHWLRGSALLTCIAVCLLHSAALFAQDGGSSDIRLQQAQFDPLQQQAKIPEELRTETPLRSVSDYYLVQFNGPIRADWRREIENRGAEVIDYVPNFAYIVRMNEGTRADLAALSQVRWTGLYQPAYRLDAVLNDTALRPGSGQLVELVVRGFAGEQAADIRSELSALGGSITFEGAGSTGAGVFRVLLPETALLDLTHVAGVAWIEPYRERELHNEIARSDEAMNQDGIESVLGLYGQGQIIAVGDTGLSTGDASTVHQDFEGRIFGGNTGPASTCGGWADNHSHGTHVAGSALGSGFHSGADIPNQDYAGSNAGIAPEAEGYIWGFCEDFTGLPADPYSDYYSVIYNADSSARINTNSWGSTTGHGGYDLFTRETDRFIWDHPDMVVTVSAGNGGVDGNSDGVVDFNSISMPATAKNIITVGASENLRLDGGLNPGAGCSTWGTCWPSDFPTDPVNSDRISDNVSGMAAFSSRGPINSGRLKPDIVAPGTNILSTANESTLSPGDWWYFDEFYEYNLGTSMATPLVAGASAVVREYFETQHSINPGANLVKAMFINGAFDMTPGQYGAGSTQDVTARPDNNQGWGRVDMVNTLVYDDDRGLEFVEHSGLQTGEDYELEFFAGDSASLRVTVVWTDFPGTEASEGALTNDLDLVVEAPDGTYLGNEGLTGGGPDRTNNIEGVDFDAPMSGSYTVRVEGFNVPEGPQPFALVVTGNFGGFELDPASAEVCTADGSLDYTLTLSDQYQGTTNLSATGLPSGTSGSFDPNPVEFPDVTSVYTLSDLGSATGGDYELEFTATDDADSENTASVSSDLTIFEAIADPIVLLTPADLATNVGLQPEFTWETATAAEYQIQVATDSGFNDIVLDEVVDGTTFTPDAELATGTDFFWRVRGLNACGDGTWSDDFEFQTRFEPIADVTPESMTIEVAPDASESDTLTIGNTGTGDLVWEIDTDMIESTGAGLLEMDPSLDESFDLPDFTVEASSTPVPVEFNVDAGELTRGDVVGFSFIGTAAGVSGSLAWASDTCMILEAPDGTTFGVGGLSGSDAECAINDWDFQGSASSEDGTYESSHEAVFDPPVPDEGEWTIRFLNDWASTSAPDINWSDVTVTLHKQPLPVCIEGEMTTVPWLSATPDNGSTAADNTSDVTVTVDATDLDQGQYEGYLCVGSNSADGETMIPVPVVADVNDPNVAVLEGTVETTGYCQADPGLVEGADVTVTGSTTATYQTTTDGDGFYSIEIPIADDPVDVTVGGAGYLDSTATGVTLDGSGVVTEDFTLQTDSPCATITPESFDFEVVLGDTDDGLLTFSNADGNVDLEWSVDDYTPASQETTRAVVLEEDFSDTTFPPTGWSHFLVSGTADEEWHRTTDQSHSGPASATRGDVSGAQDDWLVTPSINLPANAQLSFHDRGNWMFAYEKNSVLASTGSCDPNDGEFVELLEVDDTPDGSWRTEPVVVDLSAYANEDVCLAFRYEGDFAHEWWIDTIEVAEVPPSCENPNNVPWLDLSPASGITAPGASNDVTVSVLTADLEDGDYEATICVDTNDPEVAQAEVPVSLTVNDPVLGSLTGQVFSQTCSADPVPLGGAELTIEGSDGGVYTTQADASGNYFIKVHEDESPVDITATAADHVDQTASGITFQGLDVITTDLTLPAEEACAEVAPESVSFNLDADDSASGIVELSNVGHARLDWDIDTAEGGYAGFERPDPSDAVDDEKRPSQSPVVVSSGDVELTADDLQGLTTTERSDGPTMSVEGMTTGDAYDSGHPFNSNVTLDIGEGNALIGVGWEVGIETFSPSWLSESSVAFRSSPGGVEGINVAPAAGMDEPGTGNFSSEGVLFFDDAGLDPIPAGAGGTLYLEWFESFADFADDPDSTWSDSDAPLELPPGLRLICEDQAACDAAVRGDPVIQCEDPAGISWLSVNPAFGVTHVGETSDLNVELDASGLQPGHYVAGLCVASNDPVEPVISVPVALDVRTPGDWAEVEGTVESLGYCGSAVSGADGAEITIDGVNDSYTVTADENGDYAISIPSEEAPLDITAAALNHLDSTQTGVSLVAGESTTVDFSLELDEPCIDTEPDSFSSTMGEGNTDIQVLTIGNASGVAQLDWTLEEEDLGSGVSQPHDLLAATASGSDGQLQSSAAAVTGNGERITGLTRSQDRGVLLTQTADSDIAASNSVACPTGPNYLYRRFVMEDHTEIGSAVAINSVEFAIQEAASDQTITATLYSIPKSVPENTIDVGELTQIGTATIDVTTADDGTWVTVDVTGAIEDADANDLVVELEAPNAFYIGATDSSETRPGFVAAENCGMTNPTPVVDVGPDFESTFIQIDVNAENLLCASPSDVSWISFSSDTGSVDAGGSEDVDVVIDSSGLTPGEHEANICVNSNDPENPIVGVPVLLDVLDAPVIEVDPASLTAQLEDGDTDLQSFNIANSGEATLDWSIDDTTAGCELPGWASVDPVSGSVASGNGEDVDVTFDATGLEADVYDATACVDSNDPDNPVVEVDLQLTVEETLSTVEGIVMSLGYCGEDPAAAAGSGIVIEGQTGTYSDSADASGFYQISVPADDSPVSVTASHGGHITETAPGVELTAGEVSTVDMDLVLEAPCASVAPGTLSFTLLDGDESDSLTIDNSNGAASLTWTLESGPGCYDAGVDTWLTLTSSGDTVGAGASQSVDVTADATGMEPGQYTTELCMSTDDGEADEFSVPVELNVQGEVLFQDRFEMDETNG